MDRDRQTYEFHNSNPYLCTKKAGHDVLGSAFNMTINAGEGRSKPKSEDSALVTDAFGQVAGALAGNFYKMRIPRNLVQHGQDPLRLR